MGGEQRRQRAVDRRHQLDRPHVGELRQPEAAVFPRDLDPEGAQLPQPGNNLLGDLALAVDAVRVDALPQESLESLEKRARPLHLLGILLGVGMDEIHPQLAEEQVAHEARRGPLLLARGFGNLARLVGADAALRSGNGRGHGTSSPNINRLTAQR